MLIATGEPPFQREEDSTTGTLDVLLGIYGDTPRDARAILRRSGTLLEMVHAVEGDLLAMAQARKN